MTLHQVSDSVLEMAQNYMSRLMSDEDLLDRRVQQFAAGFDESGSQVSLRVSAPDEDSVYAMIEASLPRPHYLAFTSLCLVKTQEGPSGGSAALLITVVSAEDQEACTTICPFVRTDTNIVFDSPIASPFNHHYQEAMLKSLESQLEGDDLEMVRSLVAADCPKSLWPALSYDGTPGQMSLAIGYVQREVLKLRGTHDSSFFAFRTEPQLGRILGADNNLVIFAAQDSLTPVYSETLLQNLPW